MSQDIWVRRFKSEVLPKLVAAFRPEWVVLFGSRIKGGAAEESDLDCVVVSEGFAGVARLKRMPLLLAMARFDKHVDYLCYTPDEFETVRARSVVLADALEHGERLV